MAFKINTAYRKYAILSLVLASIIMLSYAILAAEPEGIVTVDIEGTSIKTPAPASGISSYGGNITQLSITATTSTRSWAAFYGNITGIINIGDSSGAIFYDWSVLSPSGEIYASESEISWSQGNIECYNYTNSTPSYLNISEFEESMGIGDQDSDGVNETFLDNLTHDSFYTGSTLFDGATKESACPTVRLFNETQESEPGRFEELIIYDINANQPVFVSLIETNSQGFNNETIDFEMILPINSSNGRTEGTVYYFYAEIE